MAISAEGVNAIKTFVVDCVLDAGGKTCPPTIVGVGGSADLCVHLAKIAATRPLGSHCADAEGRRLEAALSLAVIQLDVGPQSPGGRRDRVRGPPGNRRDAHHDEPGCGQHAMPLGAAGTGGDHAAGRALRALMRRWLFVVFMLCWTAAANAVELGGVVLPDTARLSAEGPELLLNGAGERWIMLFKIYAIGLYLPARRTTLNDVLALKGPKRLLLVIQRNELTGKQIHEYLISRISDGTQQDEMAAMQARMDDLDRIINAERSIKHGGTIALDYLPGQGTMIRVNGTAKGAPIPGEDFYQALLRIWLGERAKSTTLRDALLGRGTN